MASIHQSGVASIHQSGMASIHQWHCTHSSTWHGIYSFKLKCRFRKLAWYIFISGSVDSSKWHGFIKVAWIHQSGMDPSKWHFIKVAFHQGGMDSKMCGFKVELTPSVLYDLGKILFVYVRIQFKC